MDEGRTVNDVYLNLIKYFDMISYRFFFFVAKLERHKRGCMSQRAEVNSLKPNLWLITSDALQELILVQILFNIFIFDLDDGMEGALVLFMDES